MPKTLTKPPRIAGQDRSEKTRAAILAAAEAVFGKSGLAGARTEAIAAEAGVNKAMLYYYFRSKDELYDAVIEDHFSAFNRTALQALSAEGPARRILLNYVALHFDFISTRHRYAPLYQQLMMTGGTRMERLVRKYFLPRAQALDALLERGMRNKEFRQMDRQHTAVSITALIVFYFSAAQVLKVLQETDAHSPANLKKRKAEVINFIRYGLFTDPEAIVP
jgi:TetR/AcrR family transcriptional regulator